MPHADENKPVSPGKAPLDGRFALVVARGCFWMFVISTSITFFMLSGVNFAHYSSVLGIGAMEGVLRFLREDGDWYFYYWPFLSWTCGGWIVYILARRATMSAGAFDAYKSSVLDTLANSAQVFVFAMVAMVMFQPSPFGYDARAFAVVALPVFVLLMITVTALKKFRKRKTSPSLPPARE